MLCPKCLNRVVIDGNSLYNLLFNFAVSPGGIRISTGDLFPKPNGTFKFYCPICKEEVDKKTLLVTCDNCGVKETGDLFNISEVGLSEQCGGMFCDKCGNKRKLILIPVLSILK